MGFAHPVVIARTGLLAGELAYPALFIRQATERSATVDAHAIALHCLSFFATSWLKDCICRSGGDWLVLAPCLIILSHVLLCLFVSSSAPCKQDAGCCYQSLQLLTELLAVMWSLAAAAAAAIVTCCLLRSRLACSTCHLRNLLLWGVLLFLDCNHSTCKCCSVTFSVCILVGSLQNLFIGNFCHIRPAKYDMVACLLFGGNPMGYKGKRR